MIDRAVDAPPADARAVGAAPAGAGVAEGAPNASASESTLLAVDRTRLAHERTLMAWLRTATSMISFGFTIAKLVPDPNKHRGPLGAMFNTRTFSSILIGVALIALALASVQHSSEMRALRAKYPGHVPKSTAMVVASLVAAFGLFAFLAVNLGR